MIWLIKSIGVISSAAFIVWGVCMGIIQEEYKEDHYYVLALSIVQLMQEGQDATSPRIRGLCPGIRIGPKLNQMAKYRIISAEDYSVEGERCTKRYTLGPEFERFHSYYKKKYNAPV